MTARDWIVPAGWGAWTAILATGILIWSGDELSSALLGGAAVAALAFAAIRALLHRDPVERLLADSSAAPPLFAIGLTLVLNGVAFGLWLVLVGAEFLAFGAAFLIRERRALR